MKNTQTPQPNKDGRKQMTNRKKIIIVLWAVLVVVVLWAFLAKDLPLRERYSATVNELEKIKKDILEPAGAIEQSEAGYKPDIRGNGLIEAIFICGPDVACPTVARTWLVPIETGKELDFAKTMLARQGYIVSSGGSPCTLEKTSSCSITAKKDSYFMSINLKRTETQPATVAMSPNVWRSISVRITDFTR